MIIRLALSCFEIHHCRFTSVFTIPILHVLEGIKSLSQDQRNPPVGVTSYVLARPCRYPNGGQIPQGRSISPTGRVSEPGSIAVDGNLFSPSITIGFRSVGTCDGVPVGGSFWVLGLSSQFQIPRNQLPTPAECRLLSQLRSGIHIE